MHVYFVGTAGAGKSTLVAAYDRWCKQHGISTLLVNLDPGAEALPYEPEVDIREKLNLQDIMEEHGLGPNGAQVAAADLIALDLTDLQEEINSYRADQVLIDTPGQVELFVFRQAGKVLVENLSPGDSVVAYLLDPFLARTASGFASQLMLSATTSFRFNEPMVHLLSKSDVLSEDDVETIRAWAADAMALENDILGAEPGMSTELATNIARLLGDMGVDQTLVSSSSADGTGMDDLYALVQAAVGQAEEGTPEYDTFLGPEDDDIQV